MVSLPTSNGPTQPEEISQDSELHFKAVASSPSLEELKAQIDSYGFNELAKLFESAEELKQLIDIKDEFELVEDDIFFAMVYRLKIIQQTQAHNTQLTINAFQAFRRDLMDRDLELKGVQEYYKQELANEIINLKKTINSMSEAAIPLVESKIAGLAENIIQKSGYSKAIHDYLAMSRLIVGVVITLLTGIGFGYFYRAYSDYRYSDNSGLAKEDVEVLSWAKSPEGQFARRLWNWNSEGLTKKGKQRICETDSQDLGVNLRVQGRKTSGGWCVLWTVPPEQRVFLKD